LQNLLNSIRGSQFPFLRTTITGFGFCFLILVLTTCADGQSQTKPTSAPQTGNTDCSWLFFPDRDLIFRLDQSLRAQKQLFDFKSNKWLRSPEHRETISGECILKSVSDTETQGNLFVQITQITDQGQSIPLSPQLQQVKRITQFRLTMDGSLTKDGTEPGGDTLLILQCLFALPPKALAVGQKCQESFSRLFQTTPQTRSMKGSIDFERKPDPMKSTAKFHISLKLTSELNGSQRPGRTEWRGSGQITFSLADHRLISSVWQMVKLTETNTGKDNVPSKIIELIDVECEYKTTSRFFPIIQDEQDKK
jgi:hypothetical protein